MDMIITNQIVMRAAAASRYVYLSKPIAVISDHDIHKGQSFRKMCLKAYLDARYEYLFAGEITEFVLKELFRQ